MPTSQPEPADALVPGDAPAPRRAAHAPEPAPAPHRPNEDWQRVSPRYVWVDFFGNLFSVLIVIAVGAFLEFVLIPDPPVWLLPASAALAAVLLVYALFGIRRVRAIGYRLREDDLLFRRGIMFSRTVAVPYGRMQLIDIQRGPLLRALGLTNLKFVTAAAATDVVLPGLTDAEATQLRDRLIELAETRRSGL